VESINQFKWSIVYCHLEACLLGVKDCKEIFIPICQIFIDQFCQQ